MPGGPRGSGDRINDMTATPSGEPVMTVVMITRDRGDEAMRAVSRLLELPERVHVIVVDNGSTKNVPDFSSFDERRLDVVPIGVNLGAAGRNLGVRLARTRYVAFADDDSSWLPG